MRRALIIGMVVMVLALLVGIFGTGIGRSNSTTATTWAASSGGGTMPSPPATVTFPTGSAPADTVSFRPVLTASADTLGLELPTIDELGPVVVVGTGIVRATATPGGSGGGASGGSDGGATWTVQPLLASSPAGLGAFNAAALACSVSAASCPTGQLALVLDGSVIFAATIMTPSFHADQIQISGDWDEAQAQDIARRLSAASHG